MNTQITKHKKIWLKIATGIMITSLVVAVIPFSAVQADSPRQEDIPPVLENEGKGTAFLEKMLQREQKMNENQTNLFDKADDVIAKLESAIEKGKTNGKDVSAIEDALEEINDQIMAARAAHDKATSLLNNHTGFDDSGKVTDVELARDTIREAGRNLREAHRMIGASIRDAMKAIRECRRDNRTEE